MPHASADRAAQRRERSLKRKWLQGSQPVSSLSQIQDDEWVAYACLEAVEAGRRPRSELAALLDLGLRRTQSSAAVIRSSGIPLHDEVAVLQWMAERKNRDTADLLEVRSRLLRRQRRLELWGQLDGLASLHPAAAHEEADPWDEGGEVAGPSSTTTTTTTSVMEAGMDDFLAQAPAEHAISLALDLDVNGLERLASALDASSLTEVAARRFEVAEALMHVATSASNAAALEHAAQVALLPGAGADETERSIWLQRIKALPPAGDVVDQTGLRAALWQTDESAQGGSAGQAAPTPLDLHPRDASWLASWYVAQLAGLEEATGQVELLVVLSGLLTGPLGLGGDAELQRLDAELQGVSALARSGSRWTLRDFSEASSTSQGRRRLQKAFVRAASTPEHASATIDQGLKPFVARASGDAPEAAQAQLADLCVALLDEDDRSHALIVASATLPHLAEIDRAKLALTAFYSTPEASPTLLPTLKTLCDTALKPSTTLSGTDAGEAAALLPPLRGGSAPPASGVRSTLQPYAASEVELLSRLAHAHLAALDVFARGGVPLPPASLSAATGDAERQKRLVARVVGAFGRDRSRRKTVMEWARLWSELQTVAGGGRALDAVDAKTIAEEMLLSLLSEGDFVTFNALLPSLTLLSEEEVEAVVIQASHLLYDRATSANLHHGDMKLAYDSLAAVPSTAALKKERAFIEATSRLCSYRIPSKLRPGSNVTPIEIRLCQDRLELIARLLASQDDAYRTPELILDLAVKLCGVPTASLESEGGGNEEDRNRSAAPNLIPRPMVEIRTYAMLSDAATAAGDVETAATLCESLVERITALRKRAQHAAAYEGGAVVNSGAGAPPPPPGSASALLPQAQEVGWKTCLQVAKHPSWEDSGVPVSLMSHVLSLCPAERLEGFLERWRSLDEEFRARIESDPEFRDKVARRQADMLRRSGPGAAAAMASGGGGWSSMARGASSAAGLGNALSGLRLESYASPFSSLFASAGLTRTSSNNASPSSAAAPNDAPAGATRMETTLLGTGATKPKRSAPVGGFGRAAQLFDAFGEASSAATAAYYDPAERAALAARNLFRGFAGGSSAPGAGSAGLGDQGRGGNGGPSNLQGAGGGGAGFSLSRGVGWLMGEDERGGR